MTKDRGTDAYMAPEVKAKMMKKEGYDKKTEIYSLAIVFAQILFHLNTSDFTNFFVGQDFDKMKHHAFGLLKKAKKMEIPNHE
jgi:hypothetical protein